MRTVYAETTTHQVWSKRLCTLFLEQSRIRMWLIIDMTLCLPYSRGIAYLSSQVSFLKDQLRNKLTFSSNCVDLLTVVYLSATAKGKSCAFIMPAFTASSSCMSASASFSEAASNTTIPNWLESVLRVRPTNSTVPSLCNF